MASQATTRATQNNPTVVVMEVPAVMVVSVDLRGIPDSLDDAMSLARQAIHNIAINVSESPDVWKLVSSDSVIADIRLQPANSKTKIVGFFTREKTTPPASKNGGRNGHKV